MRAHHSTYLRLLVVLVLNAIDLLQQVADPVYLESKEACGHLPAPHSRAPQHHLPDTRFGSWKQAQLGILIQSQPQRVGPMPGEGQGETATCPAQLVARE